CGMSVRAQTECGVPSRSSPPKSPLLLRSLVLGLEPCMWTVRTTPSFTRLYFHGRQAACRYGGTWQVFYSPTSALRGLCRTCPMVNYVGARGVEKIVINVRSDDGRVPDVD